MLEVPTTLTPAVLTLDRDARYASGKVPDLSTDDLRRRLRLCSQDDQLQDHEASVASHADLNLRELLRGRVLDAWVNHDRINRLQWHQPLTVFVMHGNSERASRVARLSLRRVQERVADFLAFASDWLEESEDKRRHRERMRDEDFQRRLSQCELICGRKTLRSSGGGSDWTGCQVCPVSQL